MVSNTIYFVNLTNGLEAFHRKWIQPDKVRFIRIQSTWCEQKLWDEVILSLSDDLLMSLALGKRCIVIDFGAKKEVPRAMWQGMEFVMYCLYRLWRKEDYKTQLPRAYCSGNYFASVLRGLRKTSINKLKYYRKFYGGWPIKLTYRTAATVYDNEDEFYWKIVKSLATTLVDDLPTDAPST